MQLYSKRTIAYPESFCVICHEDFRNDSNNFHFKCVQKLRKNVGV